MRNVLAYAGKQGRRVVSAFIATAVAQNDADAARGLSRMPAGWRCRVIAAQPHRRSMRAMAWSVTSPVGSIRPDRAQANQKHGIVTMRRGSNATLPDLPVGTRVRILPNHACATGAT